MSLFELLTLHFGLGGEYFCFFEPFQFSRSRFWIELPGNTAGMTYHTPTLAIAPSQPSRVVVLRCRDTFEIDPVPVRALFTGQPEHVAEATVRRALESIAARLDRLQLARRTGAYDEIGDPARRIASIAGGLGLTDVQRIAGSVANAALSGSGTALGATLARLERCFDDAVSAVWDVRMRR